MKGVKKQVALICVLAILIVCVGWFAHRFNDKMANTVPEAVKTLNTENSAAVSFFTESKLERQNQYNTVKQEYNSIITGNASTKKAKDTAKGELKKLTARVDKENAVESLIKERGFSDALCEINDGAVEVSVKTDSSLTADSVDKIKNAVVKTTKYPPGKIIVRAKE
jgi:stage III sporulation protein AH